MIERFVEDWFLFRDAWLSGWIIATLLPIAGVILVSREQVFLGAAVSQASTAGVAVALWLASTEIGHDVGWIEHETFGTVLSVVFSVIAVLLAGGESRAGRASREAATAWVYLAAGSIAVLAAAASPHGLEEVRSLLFSSIIGATTVDVVVFGACLLAAAAVVATLRSRLILWVLDPDMARSVGVRVRAWSIGTSVAFGVVIGLSLELSGLLYTFGCLVLPTLSARNLCRRIAPLFWLAPAIGLAGAVVGFVLAHELNTPPAQLTVAILAALVPMTYVVRRAVVR